MVGCDDGCFLGALDLISWTRGRLWCFLGWLLCQNLLFLYVKLCLIPLLCALSVFPGPFQPHPRWWEVELPSAHPQPDPMHSLMPDFQYIPGHGSQYLGCTLCFTTKPNAFLPLMNATLIGSSNKFHALSVTYSGWCLQCKEAFREIITPEDE